MCVNQNALPDWITTKLLNLVSIKSGQVDPRSPEYRDLPLIAPDHIESGTGRLLKMQTAADQGAISGKYLVEPGDIVYSKIRPYLRKAYLAEFKALCSADMYPLRPRPGVDGLYILNTLLGERFTAFAASTSMRSGIPKLNRDELAQFELKVPRSVEQQQIGTMLGNADDLIASLEGLIAKKRAMKQGMMQELLTGRTRLPGFDEPWQTKPIGEVLSPRIERNTEGNALEVLSCTKHDGFVRSLDFFKNQVFSRDLNGYRVIYRGDIGYPANHIEEGSIGVQEVVDRGLVSPIYVVMHDVGGNDTYFLQRQLKMESLRQQFARATNASVNRRGSLRWNEFSRINVQVPTPQEQRTIAQVLRDVDAEIECLERRLTSTRLIKQGMMQELLTGRTRLPVEEVAS